MIINGCQTLCTSKFLPITTKHFIQRQEMGLSSHSVFSRSSSLEKRKEVNNGQLNRLKKMFKAKVKGGIKQQIRVVL